MTSKLGVYWSVMHRRQQDYDYFKRLQPTVFKIMDGGNPDYVFAKDSLPNALVIARDWAMSEQHSDMLKDPVGTGKRHAQEWSDHQAKLGFDRGKTLILGINEPQVWQPGVPEALRLYTIAMCDRATELNLRVGAMQFSVGWPGNTGPDTPPNWEPFHGVDNAIRHNNGALICHEYWADNGPGENWGWWSGRSLKCPWQVPIVIGECGVDMYVKDGSVPHNARGWRGRMEPERYARELADYVGRMSADNRFAGCAVFASDFASHEWFSFDVEPAYQAILSTPIPQAAPPTATGPGPTPVTPPVDDWDESLYAEPRYGTVTTPSLHIRGGPGTDHPITGELVNGEHFIADMEVKRQGRTWVGLADSDGWVASEYVAWGGKPTEQEPVQPVGDKWQRSREFVKKWEGGYSDNPEDHGNWTGGRKGQGVLKGTNFGISAASYPGLDIRNLTLQQADEIYFRDFWQASGADRLPWPYCLLAFDTAVLHGVDTSRNWQAETGGNPLAFAAKRLHVYTKLDNWNVFGAGWTNRTADLLEEAAK